MRRICLIATCLAWLLAACGAGEGNPATGGTEAGNAGTVSLRVIGYQSSQLSAWGLPALTVGDNIIDTARIVLDRITFLPFSACNEDEDSEGAEEIRFDGPFVVDLLDPAALSGLENVSISSGRYCEITLVFKKLEDDLPEGIDPSDPIVDRSILIEGTRQDETPFQVSTEVDEEFELENEETGFLIDAAVLNGILFIAFDIDQWFVGVNLMDSDVEVSTDGSGDPIVFINDDENEEIQETIEENLKRSADLFEDSDDDEDLDPEEEDEPLAAGTSTP